MRSKFFIPIFFLFFIPLPAFADDGNDAIVDLGWVAIGGGIIANVPFILFNKVRKYAIQSGGSLMLMGRQMTTSYKPLLNFHIVVNSLAYFAGMLHGLLLSNNMEPISLSLALVMTVLMVSGVLLRFSSSRNTKMFTRLLHGQFGLVILLVALITLHILTAYD